MLPYRWSMRQMEMEFDHKTHFARSLLFAGWGTTVFFFLDLVLLGLWIAGSFFPVSESLLSFNIDLMAFSSAILTASATMNLLARIATALLVHIRIRPFSWFIWPVYMVFGGSCLFLSTLIRTFASGLR